MLKGRRSVTLLALTIALLEVLASVSFRLAGAPGAVSMHALTTVAADGYDIAPQHLVRGIAGHGAPTIHSAPGGLVAAPIGLDTTSVLAAEDGVVIKAGSSGGETAGKAFPQSVKDAALEENRARASTATWRPTRPRSITRPPGLAVGTRRSTTHRRRTRC
jgi:hypothetical protein